MALTRWQPRALTLIRWLYWPSWAALALCALGFAWNPTFAAALGAVGFSLVVLALLIGGTTVIALRHRRVVGSWAGLALVSLGVALANSVPAVPGGDLPGLQLFAQLVTSLLLWIALAYRMVRYDAGLALILTSITLFAWSGAVANLAAGGPDRLILALVTDGGAGQLWWLQTLITGMCCICPLAPLTFVGWLGLRLWREFVGGGSI